jgi:hypothetical protein
MERKHVTYERLENSRPNVSRGYKYAFCEAGKPGQLDAAGVAATAAAV